MYNKFKWPRSNVLNFRCIKTISAELLSNKCKTKITGTQKLLIVTFQYSYEELINTSALKLTPGEKIGFEDIHIPVKN